MSIHYPEAEQQRQRRAVVTAKILGDPPSDLADRRADAERRAREGVEIKTPGPVFHFKGVRR